MQINTFSLLLVEAEPETAHLLSEMLRHSGQQPFAPFQLVSLTEEKESEPLQIDLLLWVAADGEIVTKIKALNGRFATTPLVILLPAGYEHLASQVMSAGAQDYLVMGQFDSQLLQRVCFYAIQHQRTIQAAAQQTAELREREAFLTLLNDITQTAVANLDSKTMLQLLADRMTELFRADACHITLWDEAKQLTIPVAASGHMRDTYPAIRPEPGERTITSCVLQLEKSLFIRDSTNSEYISPRITANIPDKHAILAMPLIADQQKLGAALILFDTPRDLTPDEITRCEQAARQISLAVAKARLLTSTQRSRYTADMLRAANLALTQTLELDAVLQNFLNFLATLIPFDTANVMLLQDDIITIHALRGHEQWTDPAAVRKLTFRLSQNQVFQKIANTRRGLLISDTNFYPGWQVTPVSTYVRNWIGLPLIAGGKLLGFYSMNKAIPYFFSEEHLQMAEALAVPTAVAVQNAQLFQETHLRAEQLQLASEVSNQWAHQMTQLNELGQQLTRLTRWNELCQEVVDALCHAFNYSSAVVLAVDPIKQDMVLQAICGPGADLVKVGEYRQPIGIGLIGIVAQTGQPLIVNDTRNDPHFIPSPRMHVLSEAVLPLKTGNHLIGILNVDSDKLQAFTENDVKILTLVADQLAVALDKSRLFEGISQKTAELAAIAEFSKAVREAHTTAQIFPIVLQKSLEVSGGVLGSLFLVDAETGDAVAHYGYPPDPDLLGRRFSSGQGITGHVAATRQVYIAEDLARDPIAHFLPPETGLLSLIRSTVSLPLHSQEKIVGVLNLNFHGPRIFSEDEIRLLKAMSEIAGNAIERALLFETLEQRVVARTRELKEANVRLQELDRLKTKFVSDVSHELRTPITNLNLYLELLDQGKTEKRGQYMEVLRQQTQRLGSLIGDILSLSRLELSKSTIQFTAVAFNEVIYQVLDMHLVKIEAAGLQLHTALYPSLPMVYGERNQLAQVVTNLLSNAINYTRQGQIILCTEWNREKQEVLLSVSDTGIGITPKDQAHLFERFYRGEQTSQSTIPGTGLGLAIVKEIVDLHHGRIAFESQPGKGSTFQVWLPIANRHTTTNGNP